MSNLALCLCCPITQALMENLIAMLIYRSFIIQRIVIRLFALIIKLKVNRKYCCKIHQIYKIANQYNWSFFFFTMQSSYILFLHILFCKFHDRLALPLYDLKQRNWGTLRYSLSLHTK